MPKVTMRLNGRQLPIVDLGQFGRVARLVQGLGDHEGYRFADVIDARNCQRGMRRNDRLAAALALDRNLARYLPQAVGDPERGDMLGFI